MNRYFYLTLTCLATAALTGFASAQIVTNGNFATGDSTGWTVTNDDGFNLVYPPAVDDIQDANAFNIGQISLDGPVVVSQTLSLVAGQTYVLSFEADAELGTFSGNNLFQVDLGSSIVGWQPTFPGEQLPTVFTDTFTATSSSEDLAFSGYNDQTYFEFTDVSVQAVPEPSAYAVLGLGVFGLLLRRRSRA